MSAVLVVDDEADVRLLLRLSLEGAGFEVREAPGGQAAIDALDDPIVHAMILDIRMEPIDGWAVLDHLRHQGRVPGFPVIMISAHADPSLVERAMEMGCTSYMSKPFDTRELAAKMAQIMPSRS